MNRDDILHEAMHCINVDRAATHGNAEDSFRIAGNSTHEDNYVDLAGYAALAGEISMQE